MKGPRTGNNMSGDPADPRRHLTGRGGVKYATGHAFVTRQAPHGNSATDEMNTRKSLRVPHRFGTWNVRGLNQPGKLQIVENEMERKNVQLLGISETHWNGQGHFTSDLGNAVYFSGPEQGSSRGVAFIVPQSLNNLISEDKHHGKTKSTAVFVVLKTICVLGLCTMNKYNL
ncbi:unnamed protein product [Colias eurytheme]|nr:unnamed protein product [Colias eurytheme]